jgi:hypothetical protein
MNLLTFCIATSASVKLAHKVTPLFSVNLVIHNSAPLIFPETESGETVSSSRRIIVFGGCTTGGYAGDCAGQFRFFGAVGSDYFSQLYLYFFLTVVHNFYFLYLLII